MQSMKKYEYKPLPDPAKDIRVVRVLPGAYDDGIRVEFFPRPLVVEENHVPSVDYIEYDALSYVWGSEEDPNYVLVGSEQTDEGIISVTQNLDTALRHLRSDNEPRLLWIDALCINQEEDSEKGLQVAMMGKIYSLADNVVAWLGPEDENCRGAPDLMRHWAKHVEVDWKTYQTKPSRYTDDPSWADQRKLFPYLSGELDPVCSLLSRPYFQRTWIRQEILLSKRVYIQCGQEKVPWNDFRTSIACVRWKGWYHAALQTGASLQRPMGYAYDLCGTPNASFTYANIRHFFRNTMCNDNRDRIYAVLSLLCWEDRELGINPDYSRTPEELYTDVARRTLERYQHVKLFESCELATKVLNIPSWVPDWSSQLNCARLPSSAWSACAWISAQANIMDDKTIRVAGVEVARIEQITNYYLDEYDCSWDDMLRILRQLRPSTEILRDQNSLDSCLVEKYWRSFVGDLFAGDYFPYHYDRAVLEDCIKDMEVVWSSEATWEKVVEVTSSSLQSFMSQCTDQLVGRCFFTATNDYIGLAPSGTQPNDILCVLLGCRCPVVLRPSVSSDLEQTWQVVGVCQVPGLMHGEAIYRNKLPRQLRPVFHTYSHEDDWIDDRKLAMYDPQTDHVHTDPAILLEETGIKIEKFERIPHRLDALPETLREAGVNLVDFTIV